MKSNRIVTNLHHGHLSRASILMQCMHELLLTSQRRLKGHLVSCTACMCMHVIQLEFDYFRDLEIFNACRGTI